MQFLFRPTGKGLAVGGYDGKIKLLSVASGEVIRELSIAPIDKDSAIGESVSLNEEFEKLELNSKDTLPRTQKVIGISIHPQQISLGSPLDYVQVLVTADLGDGKKADLTRMVKWSISEGLGKVDDRGIFTPSKNGKGEIRVHWDNYESALKVSVSGINDPYEPDFISEINPIISKLGCNAGTCHGAKDGKNGFKLSLRGYDPLYDIRGFTDDMASRRVNTAAPESLMLLKATGNVPHEGGQLTAEDSRYHKIIRSWIGNGARVDMNSERVQEIKHIPENPVVEKIGATQQFRVVAFYDNGKVGM